VVAEIEGVVNVLPEASEAPPVEALNQLIVFAEAAPNSTVPVPHRLPGVEDVMVGTALIVAVTEVREADRQPLLLASAK
jgi:hypothetical protein